MKIINDKVYYSWKDYAKDMMDTSWIKCDHVIGIYRGSLGMATHVSNARDVPMSIIGFQTRDGEDKEPYWIHNVLPEIKIDKEYMTGQTILIVDDIYDTGNTMNNVIDFVKKERTKPSPMPHVIGYCLFGKPNIKDITYSQEHDGSWIVFPWEAMGESF
jgi:hypoxanthine phosphoribosyltransferase|tara:strand:- start:91 stop:567 length:477 start_codon:yes stop_codon:yes gene_type:complete